VCVDDSSGVGCLVSPHWAGAETRLYNHMDAEIAVDTAAAPRTADTPSKSRLQLQFPSGGQLSGKSRQSNSSSKVHRLDKQDSQQGQQTPTFQQDKDEQVRRSRQSNRAIDISDPEVFWKTRLTAKPSTFGTSEKIGRPPTPPEVLPERLCDDWQPCDELTGQAVGRVRVNIPRGGLLNPDGSGHYDVQPFVISNRRYSPKYTISSRTPLRGPPPYPAPNAYTLKTAFESTTSYVELWAKESGRSTAPARNRHIGPGTYHLDGDVKISKYERVLEHKLKPKTSLSPRPTIAISNLFVKDHYNTDVFDQTDRADSPGSRNWMSLTL
jgi:hypothetical protein